MSFLQKNTKRKETVSSAVEEEEHEEISRDIPTLSDPQPSTSTQGKGIAWVHRAASLRMLAGIWFMASLIISTVYRSNLKAMLIMPRIQLPFDNLEELYQSQYPLYVVETTVIHRAIMCWWATLFHEELRREDIARLQAFLKRLASQTPALYHPPPETPLTC
ncbi:hypothetical protein O3P69_011106 [Scylla paramamosain]|uniref:Ionotropic glutamate receptor C-terminal domain-containing protein n=1 Tax=Scylla paramamosain TaxID=85552 RepID=A0AAW0STF6_SCYPA